jgi:hypothetical protein
VTRSAALALAFALLLLAPPTDARAQSAPPASPPGNNPVGINLVRWTEPPFLRAAAELVNSNGGDWGYVTIVVVDDDRRDPQRFQRLLDLCALYHLTPIVRVGTAFNPALQAWNHPGNYDAYLWRVFFGQIRWPTALHYLLVGNEPNLGREWGGAVDPAGYARYLATWIDVFASDPRYRIFNAALDASNDTLLPDRMDEFEFIEGMRAAVPNLFARLHGWASSPYHFWWGTELRYTYRAYETELEAIGRELPVIVTEFHPAHVDDALQIAGYYETAFSHWLADPRVIAATPMFWNPESNRFWMYGVNGDGSVAQPSPTYFRIKSFPKVAGSPEFRPPHENVARPPSSPAGAAPQP